MQATREHIERIDAQLAAQSRADAALRLRVGQTLEVLGRGGCFELGFSSLTAYALERCELSVRSVESARCLARRLEALPALRRAVAFGALSWSKAVLVARVATPGDEARWVHIAVQLTVRQLAAHLNEDALPSDAEGALADGDEVCTLVCTVGREEAWLFEATRALLDQLGTSRKDEQLEALLAEAQTHLLDALPRNTLDLEAAWRIEPARARWREQLARLRTEAEVRCESSIQEHEGEDSGRASATRRFAAPRGADGCEALESTMLAAANGSSTLESLTPRELDVIVRNLARALAEHELTLSRLILELHRADGWRRLGYATEAQYARERLGMSRSALLARRALATRLESLPRIAEALSRSRIGVEAALQLIRIATPKTERAWLVQAERRTIKHLREEVNAALIAVRLSGDAECPPPAEVEINAFYELERAASSGRIFNAALGNETDSVAAVHGDSSERSGGADGSASDASASDASASDASASDASASDGREAEKPGAWSVTLASLAEWLERGVQMCAGHSATMADVQTCAASVRHHGRVELRLRVSRETYRWWRGLERQARRWLPRGMSWLRFCCLAVWRAWRPLLSPKVAYGHIYIRDRHRCTSPVCTRRDVTPHHLQFRSAGGSNEEDNVVAVCSWCHLLGIHGGRIRAVGRAGRIRWELGRHGDACLVVDGRERRG